MLKISDAHCDMLFKMSYDKKSDVDIKQLNDVSKLQVFSIWDDWQKVDCGESITKQHDIYLSKIKNEAIFKPVLSLEGLDVLNDNKEFISYLMDSEIKIVHLTWNYNNCVAGGVNSSDGLSSFGKNLVKLFKYNDIIVDLSHLNKKSFYDVVKVYDKPLFASHSNCFSLCNHKRNLDDDQIKLISKSNGIIGICFYPAFLTTSDYATSKDIANHIDYVCQLTGKVDNVCFGSDFDGIDTYPKDIKNFYDVYVIYDHLIKKGYKNCDICKIFYGNLYDFILK